MINLHLPPLRERRADIPLLAAHFIAQQNASFHTKVTGLSPESRQAASDFDWPGNIRQLKNVIEACLTIETEELISLDVIGQFIRIDERGDEGADYGQALANFEIDYLKQLLRDADGNVDEAAQRAGMNMATIYRKLKKYGIKKSDRA